MITCLFQYKTIGCEHIVHFFDITVFGGGSGECILAIMYAKFHHNRVTHLSFKFL